MRSDRLSPAGRAPAALGREMGGGNGEQGCVILHQLAEHLLLRVGLVAVRVHGVELSSIHFSIMPSSATAQLVQSSFTSLVIQRMMMAGSWSAHSSRF